MGKKRCSIKTALRAIGQFIGYIALLLSSKISFWVRQYKELPNKPPPLKSKNDAPHLREGQRMKTRINDAFFAGFLNHLAFLSIDLKSSQFNTSKGFLDNLGAKIFTRTLLIPSSSLHFSILCGLYDTFKYKHSTFSNSFSTENTSNKVIYNELELKNPLNMFLTAYLIHIGTKMLVSPFYTWYLKAQMLDDKAQSSFKALEQALNKSFWNMKNSNWHSMILGWMKNPNSYSKRVLAVLIFYDYYQESRRSQCEF